MRTLLERWESRAILKGTAAPPRWLSLVLLGVLWALVFLPRLNTPAIFDDSDAMYAQVPREMVQRGDWITPYADSVRYLEKPPLFYWLVAGCYRLFGVSPASARLGPAVVCLGLVLVAYLLGELLFDAVAGWVAGAVMATSAGYYLFTQQLMPDPLFSLLLALGFYSFLRGDAEACLRRGNLWSLGGFAALGLAVLAKGLIGLVFPLLTLGAYALWRVRTGRPIRVPLGAGMGVFTAVAAPWHLLVGVRNPGWAWFYFVNEHLLRFLNRREPRDYGTVPLLAFWLLHLVWLFPWSVFLPVAVRGLGDALRSHRRRPADRRAGLPESAMHRQSLAAKERWQDGLLFVGIWAGAVLVFFSFSTRLEYYSMPAYPALALLIGAEASRLMRTKGGRNDRLFLASLRALWLTAAAMLLAAVALGALAIHRPAGPLPPLDDPQSPYSVYFFSPVFHLTMGHLARLAGGALGVTLFAFVGATAALRLAGQGRVSAVPGALAAAMVPCLACLHHCFLPIENEISSRALAAAIMRRWQPRDLLVADGQYETYNSLNFYTGQPLSLLEGRRGYLAYGSRYPDCPPLFLDRTRFERLLATRGPHQLFLVTRSPRRFANLRPPPASIRVCGGKRLLLFHSLTPVPDGDLVAGSAARPSKSGA